MLVDDFHAGAIERASDDGVMVIPEVQKRGYRNAFEVDHSLAARVVRFIAMRKRWLARRGWGESQGKGRLFVSVRTGKPLGNKTLVQILGTAFRAVGVPAKRGAGHHSFRRKYSDQSTREDLQARKITGHSVAVEDVLHAAAIGAAQNRLSRALSAGCTGWHSECRAPPAASPGSRAGICRGQQGGADCRARARFDAKSRRPRVETQTADSVNVHESGLSEPTVAATQARLQGSGWRSSTPCQVSSTSACTREPVRSAEWVGMAAENIETRRRWRQ